MDAATRTCPYCAETIRAEAMKCRYCGSRVNGGSFDHSWYRLRQGRRIAGVCAGLAQEFGVSVSLLRLGFLLSLVLGGWGLVVYLALWVIMPLKPS